MRETTLVVYQMRFLVGANCVRPQSSIFDTPPKDREVQEQMNKYEMGVIVRADLEDEAFRAEMDRVKGLIDRFGGNIEKIDEWGRRKLAYPIAKQPEGMYTFITYTSEGPTPREVESRLRLMESVLRFLTIRKDETESVTAAPAKPEPVKAAAEAETETASPAEEPVSEPVAEESTESGE